MKKKKLLTTFTSLALCSVLALSTACSPKKEDSNSGTGATGGGDGGSTNETTIKDTEIVLAKDNASSYQIVVPDAGALVITTGATEIQTYLKYSTGADLPIISDSGVESHSDNDYVISVGETTMFAASGIQAAQAELTHDGYKIVRKANTVYIIGASDRATAYGCMEFLEHQIGYEVYTASEIAYEKYDTLYLKDFNLTDVPDFELRSMDGMSNIDQDTSFRLRLGQLFGNATEKYDNSNKAFYIPNADHNTELIISTDKNPEYEKYQPMGSLQICFTQGNGLEKAYITELIKYIEAMPDAYIVNVSQEDGKNFCTCTTCTQEKQLYGTSGMWIRFLNKVINGVEAWREENCPERYLKYTTYCYGETLEAPVDLQEDGTYLVKDPSCIPHEKLDCRITANSCPLHVIGDPDCSSNLRRENMINGWRAITKNFGIWDYAAYYQCYLPFYDDVSKVKDSKVLYKEMGVNDYFIELNSGGSFTQFGYLRMYLNAKLMWNVDEDVKTLTDNFFDNYYKAASKEMRQIYELMRTHNAMSLSVQSSHSSSASLSMFPRRLIDQMDVLFDKAEEAAAKIEDITERETVEKRIYYERGCNEFLKVYFYDNYGYERDEYATQYNRLVSYLTTMGMPRFREHESMEAWLETVKPQ